MSASKLTNYYLWCSINDAYSVPVRLCSQRNHGFQRANDFELKATNSNLEKQTVSCTMYSVSRGIWSTTTTPDVATEDSEARTLQ